MQIQYAYFMNMRCFQQSAMNQDHSAAETNLFVAFLPLINRIWRNTITPFPPSEFSLPLHPPFSMVTLYSLYTWLKGYILFHLHKHAYLLSLFISYIIHSYCNAYSYMLIDCAPVEPWEEMHGTGMEPSESRFTISLCVHGWNEDSFLVFQTSLWNELITNTLLLQTAHAPSLKHVGLCQMWLWFIGQ